MRQLISLKEARKFLKSDKDKPTGMSDTKIRKIIKTDPTFPAYLIGGEYMIDTAKLDEWIEQKRVGAGANIRAYESKLGRPAKVVPKAWDVNTPGWNPTAAV